MTRKGFGAISMAFTELTRPAIKKRLSRSILRGARRLLFKVIYGVPAGIAWLLRYRIVVIGEPGRIGHLAIEADWFLKKQALGDYGAIKPILLASPGTIANPTLLAIWGLHISIITNAAARFLLRPLTYFSCLTIHTSAAATGFGEGALYPLVNNRWGERAPIFRLPTELQERGRNAMRELGVPEDAWFVCVHARDGVYSPGDEKFHAYRNGDISNCDLAVDTIIARGGWCIRMGETGTASLRERPGLVNYPDTKFKSDWMDVFLCANTRFFLGNTSGLCLVSTITNIPSALVNMTPHGGSFGLGHADISIPKQLRRNDGTGIELAEIFNSGASVYRYKSQFEDAGLDLIENNAEEIRDLVIEMLDILDGTNTYSEEDDTLQLAYRDMLRAHHYSKNTQSRIGAAYLRAHRQELLPQPSSPAQQRPNSNPDAA